MSATAKRQQLSDHHSYLSLAYALIDDHSPASKEVRLTLNQVKDFLESATSRSIREQGRRLLDLLKRATSLYDPIIPRKRRIQEIARDFRALASEEQDIWRYGIPVEWLRCRFDLSRLPQAEDLPGHARIGIGVHAGYASVEEAELLSDAFFCSRWPVGIRNSCMSLLRVEGWAPILMRSQEATEGLHP